MNQWPRGPKTRKTEQRRRAAALHDAGANSDDYEYTRSVLECGSPLPLFLISATVLGGPAIARFPFQPLVEFGDVGDFHVGAVPHNQFLRPRVLREVAQKTEFGQTRPVFKWRRGVGSACAAGFDKVSEWVFIGPRQ